jgi:hypothetical protein
MATTRAGSAELGALLTQGGLGPGCTISRRGTGSWLLTPFRLVVQPWFAHNGREFLVTSVLRWR